MRVKMLFVFSAVLLYSLAFPQKIKFDDSWGSQGFNLSKSAVSGVSLTYSVNEFSMEKVLINNEMLTTVQLSGVFLPNDEGAPNLPGSSRYIAIPQGATAKYVINGIKKEVYQNVDLAPAPKIPWDNDKTPMVYKRNSEIYSKNAFYPSSPVILSEPSKIRGLDVVMLGITPFQYNPVTKELIVYRDLKVDVTFEGGNGHFGEDRLRNAEWDKILKNTVLNNSVLEDVVYKKTSDSKTDDYEYIIICPDNATFISYANQLKVFRTKQGIRTGVVTTTQIGGNTSAAIEAYINNAYNNWDIPPSAVLMMADYGAEGTAGTLFVPKFVYSGSPYCVSDNFYADVITTDAKGLPEITFARMTAQNETHLQTMVSKIINYETNPPTDPSFYNNPVTALGWQTERWFQICSETIGGFMKNQLGKTPLRINEVYDGNPAVDPWSIATNTSQVLDYFGPSGRGYIPASPTTLGGWTGGDATDITNAINSGTFIVMHRDHGNVTLWGEPSYTSTNISSLTNTSNKLPFIFSIDCLTGQYDYSSEVFSEKFHRYTYSGQNSGAVGVICASQSSMSFVNDAFAWGIIDYIWPDYMPDYGASPTVNDMFFPAFAMVNGKYFLDYSSWPYNYYDKELTNYLFHTFGDPYLNVYSEVPQNLTVVKQELYESETIFYVSANAGSKIALVSNGQILATATGTGAVIPVTIAPQSVGTQITLTITKQNYFRYETTFQVLELTNIGGTFSKSISAHNYGIVNAGESSNVQFTITNSHSTEFIVGDMTTISGYSVTSASKDVKNDLHFVVPPASSKTFNLTFAPPASGTYNGNITITTTDPNHATEYIAVTGTGAAPDINVPALVAASCAPGSSVGKTFAMANDGLQQLDYSMSKTYSGYAIPAGNYHTNDFQSGLIYTNSGGISWATATGGTWNNSTTCAAITASGTGIMTSPAFNSTTGGSTMYLDFDQTSTHVSGTSRKVEWYNGSSWVQVYYNNTSAVTDHQHISVTGVSSSSQLRFTGVNVKSGPTTSSWRVDNIVISYENVPYTWLTINSALTGSVLPAASNDISITCNAAGLAEGTYDADITIVSNDPSEPSKVVPVEFTVAAGGTPPAAPSLVSPSDASTLYILKPVFDWSDVSGANSYTILVDNNSDFSSPEINQSPAASSYTPVADMVVGTYQWKVLSTNTYGSSSYSSAWSVIIAPLSQPINVITTLAEPDLTVSWDPVTGATTYDVYSSADPYGTYTFVTNVATNSYTTTVADAMKFWYIVAKN